MDTLEILGYVLQAGALISAFLVFIKKRRVAADIKMLRDTRDAEIAHLLNTVEDNIRQTMTQTEQEVTELRIALEQDMRRQTRWIGALIAVTLFLVVWSAL